MIFFPWIIFPQAPENTVRIISNFFENSQRFWKSRYTTGINNTCGKFATGANYTSAKFATGINETGCKLSHRYCWCCWYRWPICRGGRSTNCKSTNLWSYKICYICGILLVWQFADLWFEIPIFLRFADPYFLPDLKLCKSANSLLFSLQIHT